VTVKMPVLGASSRRRKSSGRSWLLLLAAVAAAAYAWRWRAQHRRPAPEAAPAPLTAPGSTPGIAEPGPTLSPAAPPLAAVRPAGPKHLSVPLDGALETALVQGVGRETGPALAQVLKRLLVWGMRVPADLQRGDHLDLLYEERPGEEPLVHAVRLVSGKLQRTVEVYRFRGASDAFARYYLPGGEELELRLDPSPLDAYEQVTSLIRDGRGHKGVDFKTPVGSPVKSTFDGTVTRKNWFFRGNGNSLEITETAAPHRKALFLHLSELPRTLKPGTTVGRGEVIARSGNSGHSFAPHLHYQLESPDSRVLDPFNEHATRRASLAASDRQAFDAAVAAAREQLSAPRIEAAASTPVAPPSAHR
jgi:murein DD-endopeptidase